jgi:hypothetical protein
VRPRWLVPLAGTRLAVAGSYDPARNPPGRAVTAAEATAILLILLMDRPAR